LEVRSQESGVKIIGKKTLFLEAIAKLIETINLRQAGWFRP
jgi:hypothetical protein